ICISLFLLIIKSRHTTSTLFPYTTLFRSGFIHFSNHTDTKGGQEFSADFPAYLSRALKAHFGQTFVPIYGQGPCGNINHVDIRRSEEHTSELQSRENLLCRPLLEKKKIIK